MEGILLKEEVKPATRLTDGVMGRKPDLRKCLLCFSKCSSSEEDTNERSSAELVMAGAVNCHVLERQLENIFILRKILDVTETFCEETLQEKIVDDEEDEGGDPSSWFSVCGDCMESNIAQAWKVYQDILALEVKLLGIKKTVKKRMKEEIIKPRNRSWAWQQIQRGEVEGKIRRFMFPDLLTKKEVVSDTFDLLEDSEEEMEAFCEMNENSNCSDEPWLEDALTPEADPLDIDNSDFLEGGGRKRKKPKQKKGRPKKYNPIRFPLDESRFKPKMWHQCRHPKCFARYRSQEELDSHLEAHKRGKHSLDCSRCQFPARDQNELDKHMITRHKHWDRLYTHSCPKCDFKVENDFPTFKAHYDQEHPPPVEETAGGSSQGLSSELPIYCEPCSKRCSNLKAFITHQRTMHPEQLGIQIVPLECNECGMKFSTEFELRSHQKMKHKLDIKVVCDECGKGFGSQSALNYHKVTHVKRWKKEFVCDVCGLDYAYKWILEKHRRENHSSQDPEGKSEEGVSGDGKVLNCKFCDFTAPFKAVLMRHLQEHKKEIGYRCEQCDKYYFNEQGLKRHLKINHPSVKEEVPCPYCKKAFCSVDYMKDHVKKYCRVKKLTGQQSSSAITGVSSESFGEATSADVGGESGGHHFQYFNHQGLFQ